MPFTDWHSRHEPDHYDIDTEEDIPIVEDEGGAPVPLYTEEEFQHSIWGEAGGGPAQPGDETGNEKPIPWPEGYEPDEDLPF